MKHIKELELQLAVFLALKSFTKELYYCHFRIFVDNNTVMACLNKKGSSNSKSITLESLRREIWDLCEQKKIWLSAARIVGCDNVEADRYSQKVTWP